MKGLATTKILIIAAIATAAFFLLKISLPYITGSVYNIKDIAKVKGTLEKSFSENQTIILYLKDNSATIKRGEAFGIAFGIKNLGVEGNFSYSVTAKEGDCQNPEKIVTAGSGSTKLMENSTYFGLIIFEPVKDMSRCTEIFKLRVEKDGIEYEESILNVTIS